VSVWPGKPTADRQAAYDLSLRARQATLAGHAFFRGEKVPPPRETNVVIAAGNCGSYTGPAGVRMEDDTVVVGPEEPIVPTNYLRRLEKKEGLQQ